MKNITLTISLLLLSLVVNSQTFTLNVTGGYKSISNQYNEGDTIHLYSRAVFGDSVFINWSGSATPYLLESTEWHSRIVVPTGTNIGTLSAQANFDKLPNATIIDVDSLYLFGIDSMQQDVRVFKKIHYGIPPSPKAIVFLFHGTGGSGKPFFNNFEKYQLTKDLIYNGYAVFTMDANESTFGDNNLDSNVRWDTKNPHDADTSSNVDLLNIQLAKDSLLTIFGFNDTMPIFSLGVSNGAVFSDLCATALGFNASAHITAKSKNSIYTRESVRPVIWIMSENDHEKSANNSIAFSNYTTLLNLQPYSKYHYLKRSPFYPERFIRSTKNVSSTESKMIFDALVAQGYLDVNYYMNNLLTNAAVTNFFNQNNQLGFSQNKLNSIRDEFLCANADHILHSDFNKRIITFFDQILTFTVNVDELSASNIKVYPNPANHYITFDIQNEIEPNLMVKIYSIQGQLIIVKNIQNKNNATISLETLQSGLYLYQLANNENIIKSGIIIVQH